MYRIKCVSVEDGPGPNEKAVKISTAEGEIEEVILPAAGVDGDSLELISVKVLDRLQRGYLVELPRETSSGKWRVWLGLDTVREAQ